MNRATTPAACISLLGRHPSQGGGWVEDGHASAGLFREMPKVSGDKNCLGGQGEFQER
jgi:hypothetical protein